MEDNKKNIRYENGRIYMSREAERKLYFFLTVIMLAAGAMFKTGLL